jgi:hypothetical protein
MILILTRPGKGTGTYVFSTNKCKDSIKDINWENNEKNKIKKITTKNNEIHTVLCLERTLCFIKIDKFDRTM